MRVFVNSNLTSIINYINDYQGILTWYDLVSWCIDLKYYKDLYLNHFIFKYLLDEHNQSIKDNTFLRKS